jgi:Peptidase_C39 like family
MDINYDVPYFSQANNEREPWRHCGSTSTAMSLKYYNIPDPGDYDQYEDDIDVEFHRRGFDHKSTGGIRRLIESFGLLDNLTEESSLKDIDRALQGGKIVIIHGMFTSSGHIIVIRGLTDQGSYYVNDPAGEWFPDGYDYNTGYGEDTKGKNQIYSRRLIASACAAYTLREALDNYKIWDDNQIESTSNIWLHRISK